jgi:hypothetical protein
MGYPYRTYKSGAQKGLEQKMEYWHQKDFNTEFNILVGQAINLAAETGKEYGDSIDERIVFFFRKLLQTRSDDNFQREFEQYYQKRETQKQRSTEKKDVAFMDSILEKEHDDQAESQQKPLVF